MISPIPPSRAALKNALNDAGFAPGGRARCEVGDAIIRGNRHLHEGSAV